MKKLSKKQIILLCSVGAVLLIAAVLFFIFSQKTTVPNVVGMSVNEAVYILEDIGFEVETVEAVDQSHDENEVLSQNIPAYSRIYNYDVDNIVLTVNSSVLQVTVPDVIKMPAKEAQKTLSDLGFKVTVTEDYHSDYQKGLVTSQSIRARTVADKGSEIALVVSKGVERLKIPDISGKSLSEVKKLFANTGIHLNIFLKPSSTVKEDTVISQGIKAGISVTSGTSLTVEVSIGKANSLGTTPSNAKDHPSVVLRGDWIYFIDEGVHTGIFRQHKDGSDQQLLHSGPATGLNVIGNWLFFVDLKTQKLMRMRIDGTQSTSIGKGKYRWAYVTTEAIYSTDGEFFGSIYKSDINGYNKSIIYSGMCADITVYGNRIYFINYDDGHKVYSIDINGKNPQIVWNDSCSEITADGGNLYITSTYEIIQLNLKTKKSKTLIDEYGIQKMCINVSNGWVYYLELDFNKTDIPTRFCKIKTDGSSYTRIYTFAEHIIGIDYMNVADGWVYFTNPFDMDCLYRVKNSKNKPEKLVE
ncbi:MAG: DUF5050 domain-containing protein [Clostridia bacterium]|nr:DUF5050 domain-containing protein [Clostridia bacterium]